MNYDEMSKLTRAKLAPNFHERLLASLEAEHQAKEALAKAVLKYLDNDLERFKTECEGVTRDLGDGRQVFYIRVRGLPFADYCVLMDRGGSVSFPERLSAYVDG